MLDAQFCFSPDDLAPIAGSHRSAWESAEPFPHVVIDGLIPDDVLDAVISEFPAPDAGPWNRYENPREKKLEGTDVTAMGPVTRNLFHELNGAAFLQFLEALTGIEGLIADPYLRGGGLHQIEPGGFLKVHADFNWHHHLRLDRRLNLLVYLNRSWQEEWGGHLQLWDRDMTHCVRRILPVFGRCVLFATTDDAHHGHPDPLASPEGVMRRSLALYYYSNGRPAEEIADVHGTAFAPRPGERWRREVKPVGTVARRWLPPVLYESLKNLRRR